MPLPTTRTKAKTAGAIALVMGLAFLVLSRKQEMPPIVDSGVALATGLGAGLVLSS